VYIGLLKKFGGVLLVMATSSSPGSAATLYVLALMFDPMLKEFHKMKQVLLRSTLAVAVVLGGASAYAQMGAAGAADAHGPRQPMSTDQRLQMLTSQLNLSSDQQSQIKPILESESQQMQALRSDTALSQQDRMSKMQAIRKDTASQIKPILNADQQTKYQEMMSHQGHRGGMGAAPPQSQPQ